MVERDYEEWDVHGKWVEVEEGEEEMKVVGDKAREEEDGQGEQADPLVEEDERAEEGEPLHQLREVDPRPLDGGPTARRKRWRRVTWESRRRWRRSGGGRRGRQRRTHWMPNIYDGRSPAP
ncbi:uncharacterized protein A4U43_C01F16230 [Asparagus officinalis]|uniref:Uncharacterized protein n=1 Tax=Asparagus officinalis TaxID=4686 RepID=A0A5P1FUG3_ASPOF|nr:uncharacterized protein A4U43_C01F16230 [Asparagus officinalis]